jgi:hypothetical protein
MIAALFRTGQACSASGFEKRQLEHFMKTKTTYLTMLAIWFSVLLVQADGLTNNSTNSVKRVGSYSMMRGTNGGWVFANPSEFWNGIWKEDTNGWRVQLRIFAQTNLTFVQGQAYPVSTNLILRVQWGSIVKNSGNGYYLPPNGKFAKLELRDANGNVIPPNPDAGTNLLFRNLKGEGFISFPDLKSVPPAYETNLPPWADPSSGSLMANFPKIISANVYPHSEFGYIVGEIPGSESVTNFPPLGINALKLDEAYSVTNEGDYKLTVQPVLYKKRIETNILDRVDLPSVTTKVHLLPNTK